MSLSNIKRDSFPDEEPDSTTNPTEKTKSIHPDPQLQYLLGLTTSNGLICHESIPYLRPQLSIGRLKVCKDLRANRHAPLRGTLTNTRDTSFMERNSNENNKDLKIQNQRTVSRLMDEESRSFRNDSTIQSNLITPSKSNWTKKKCNAKSKRPLLGGESNVTLESRGGLWQIKPVLQEGSNSHDEETHKIPNKRIRQKNKLEITIREKNNKNRSKITENENVAKYENLSAWNEYEITEHEITMNANKTVFENIQDTTDSNDSVHLVSARVPTSKNDQSENFEKENSFANDESENRVQENSPERNGSRNVNNENSSQTAEGKNTSENDELEVAETENLSASGASKITAKEHRQENDESENSDENPPENYESENTDNGCSFNDLEDIEKEKPSENYQSEDTEGNPSEYDESENSNNESEVSEKEEESGNAERENWSEDETSKTDGRENWSENEKSETAERENWSENEESETDEMENWSENGASETADREIWSENEASETDERDIWSESQQSKNCVYKRRINSKNVENNEASDELENSDNENTLESSDLSIGNENASNSDQRENVENVNATKNIVEKNDWDLDKSQHIEKEIVSNSENFLLNKNNTQSGVFEIITKENDSGRDELEIICNGNPECEESEIILDEYDAGTDEYQNRCCNNEKKNNESKNGNKTDNDGSETFQEGNVATEKGKWKKIEYENLAENDKSENISYSNSSIVLSKRKSQIIPNKSETDTDKCRENTNEVVNLSEVEKLPGRGRWEIKREDDKNRNGKGTYGKDRTAKNNDSKPCSLSKDSKKPKCRGISTSLDLQQSYVLSNNLIDESKKCVQQKRKKLRKKNQRRRLPSESSYMENYDSSNSGLGHKHELNNAGPSWACKLPKFKKRKNNRRAKKKANVVKKFIPKYLCPDLKATVYKWMETVPGPQTDKSSKVQSVESEQLLPSTSVRLKHYDAMHLDLDLDPADQSSSILENFASLNRNPPKTKGSLKEYPECNTQKQVSLTHEGSENVYDAYSTPFQVITDSDKNIKKDQRKLRDIEKEAKPMESTNDFDSKYNLQTPQETNPVLHNASKQNQSIISEENENDDLASDENGKNTENNESCEDKDEDLFQMLNVMDIIDETRLSVQCAILNIVRYLDNGFVNFLNDDSYSEFHLSPYASQHSQPKVEIPESSHEKEVSSTNDPKQETSDFPLTLSSDKNLTSHSIHIPDLPPNPNNFVEQPSPFEKTLAGDYAESSVSAAVPKSEEIAIPVLLSPESSVPSLSKSAQSTAFISNLSSNILSQQYPSELQVSPPISLPESQEIERPAAPLPLIPPEFGRIIPLPVYSQRPYLYQRSANLPSTPLALEGPVALPISLLEAKRRGIFPHPYPESLISSIHSSPSSDFLPLAIENSVTARYEPPYPSHLNPLPCAEVQGPRNCRRSFPNCPNLMNCAPGMAMANNHIRFHEFTPNMTVSHEGSRKQVTSTIPSYYQPQQHPRLFTPNSPFHINIHTTSLCNNPQIQLYQSHQVISNPTSVFRNRADIYNGTSWPNVVHPTNQHHCNYYPTWNHVQHPPLVPPTPSQMPHLNDHNYPHPYYGNTYPNNGNIWQVTPPPPPKRSRCMRNKAESNSLSNCNNSSTFAKKCRYEGC